MNITMFRCKTFLHFVGSIVKNVSIETKYLSFQFYDANKYLTQMEFCLILSRPVNNNAVQFLTCKTIKSKRHLL